MFIHLFSSSRASSLRQRKGESMTDKTIKIFVDGGCVTDVFNLPDGFDYVIIDSDVLEEE